MALLHGGITPSGNIGFASVTQKKYDTGIELLIDKIYGACYA